MTAGRSTEQQRAQVLEKLLDTDLDPSDCVKYGFFMGTYYPGPIPDYNGNEVLNEIKPIL